MLWIGKRELTSNKIEIQYAGQDVGMLKKCAIRLEKYCTIISNEFLEVERLRELQAGAWVNAYIYNERSLFQHKTLELMSAGKPILTVPSESLETFSIIKSVEACFASCATPSAVANALTRYEKVRDIQINVRKMAFYSWESQAEILERVLTSAGRSL